MITIFQMNQFDGIYYHTLFVLFVRFNDNVNCVQNNYNVNVVLLRTVPPGASIKNMCFLIL